MVLDPALTTGAPPVKLRGWRKVVILAVWNLAVLFLLLLLSELAARVWVWSARVPTQFVPQPFHGFGQTDPVLWWRLRPDLDLQAQGVRIRTNSLGFRDRRESIPSGTVLGFCLGDSTTYGWELESDLMYSAVTERLLNERGPQGMTVVSAGVPGYTSYQCLRQLRSDVLPLRPQWVSILASNNECRSRIMGDRDRGRLLDRKSSLQNVLGFSRLWTLLTRVPESLRRSFESDPPPGRVANTPEEYRENIREITRRARESGCRVVVLSLPLRLRYPPFWKTHDHPRPEVAALVRQAEAARTAGAPLDRQAALWEDALRLQPDQFRAHWQLGQVELQRGRPDAADRQFALARDDDLHPEAAKPCYNEVLQTLCAEEHVPFVDLNLAFARSGLADEALFLDHCHVSALGHQIIAEALATQVRALMGPP